MFDAIKDVNYLFLASARIFSCLQPLGVGFHHILHRRVFLLTANVPRDLLAQRTRSPETKDGSPGAGLTLFSRSARLLDAQERHERGEHGGKEAESKKASTLGSVSSANVSISTPVKHMWYKGCK
jgi:hypothetical protein